MTSLENHEQPEPDDSDSIFADFQSLIGRQNYKPLMASGNITQNAPRGDEIAFLERTLAQVSLFPYRNPGSHTYGWERRNGDVRLLVQPVTNLKGEVMWPYGIIPRLAMLHIANEITLGHTTIDDGGNTHMSLGETLNEFLRSLGISGSGKEYKKVRQQLNALFNANITITNMAEGDGNNRFLKYSIALVGTVLWQRGELENAEPLLPGSDIILNPVFVAACKAHAFPIDLRAANALRTEGGGAMAYDIYVWLAYRMGRGARPGPVHVTWKQLAEQFGGNFTRTRAFKEKFLEQLRRVQNVFPGLHYEATPAQLIVFPAPPPVARTTARGLLHE